MMLETRRAAVCVPVAPLLAEPRVRSAQISQLLAGRVLDLLDICDDWLRVRGPDQYEGWLHCGYVALAPEDGAHRSMQVERISLGCVTTLSSGLRRVLPLGAFLAANERVTSGEAIDSAQRAEFFPPEAGAITRTAQQYFEGTSYLWGGVTPWGADCSGLVQSVYWLHGIQLPRDAWEQAKCGAAGDANPMAARAGDLLFFSDRVDRSVTHVAIALGGLRIVHLALGRGGYAVERLDDARDPYVKSLIERFVTSRRSLDPTLARQ